LEVDLEEMCSISSQLVFYNRHVFSRTQSDSTGVRNPEAFISSVGCPQNEIFVFGRLLDAANLSFGSHAEKAGSAAVNGVLLLPIYLYGIVR
jgi:hypothetical protein